MQKRLKKIQLGTEINVDVKNNIGMIDNILGNSYQSTREGYNLFDYLNKVENGGGLTYTLDKETGYIIVNGTPEWDYTTCVKSFEINDLLEDGKTYSIWQEVYSDTTIGGLYCQVAIKHKTDGNIQYINSSQSRVNFIVDKNQYNYNMMLQIGTIAIAGTFNNYKNRYMLYEGTDNKTFELYGSSPTLENPSEVESVGENKNLFDKETAIDGYRIGTDGALFSDANYFASGFIKVQPNTQYTVNYTLELVRRIGYYDEEKIFISGNTSTSTFTVPENCKYIRLGGPKILLDIAKLEKGAESTLYSSYGQGNIEIIHNNEQNAYILPIQEPLRKIGNYMDGFAVLDRQWYEQHFIKELVLTGEENFNVSSIKNTRMTLKLKDIVIQNADEVLAMSNSFLGKTYNETQQSDLTNVISINNGYLSIDTDNITDTSTFKSKLQELYNAGTPVKVYYVLSDAKYIKCTEEQNSILNALSNIELYNGINHIYTSDNMKPTLKFLYYDKTEKDDDIYVFDKNENLIAVFDKDDEDTIINPQVHDLQNTESTFSFSISLKSKKWEQINNAENLYYVDNKMFSTNFDECFTSTVDENNEDLVAIIAYERQKLLERRYVRAWNSEDGFENVDTFMCVILSKGNLELKNNGELVNSTHLKGSSGYVLDGLLYGTGWTTGVCDVEGEFDFETDQVDIYNNILKVQEIWGGIIVVDSVNKIIEHRDETKFLPYDGFEVRYQKNMQSLEKIYNNKIITELCPLGEGGLNIKSVNGGSEWLTNYSYSSSRLQGIENNADITDPVQLKAWGERKLKDLCKPSKELNVKAILLNQIEGFEHEVIGLNDIVDVIDYQFIVGDIEQLRVVEYTHKLWDNSDAEIVLSDITLDSTDIFKKTVSATDTINNGTLTTNKVVDFFKNGQSLNQTLTQIGDTIEQTKTDFSKTDEEIQATITQMTTVIDNLNHNIISQQEIINNLEITIDGLQNQLTVSGGNNLLRNSVGIFGNEYWEGTITNYTDTDIQQNNISKNAIFLQNGSIMQEILRLKNGFYNISFNYKKLLESAVCKVKINNDIEIDLNNTSWDIIEEELEILDNYFRIEFVSDSNNACYISDLILIVGRNKQTWTQNINETTSDTVSIGQGIRVDSDATNTYTRIDSDGNRTFNKATNEVVMAATDKGVEAENIVARTQAEITGILQQKVGDQIWGALL